MSSEWAHQFCLSCDRQTDGAAYCSESCRLADYEKTSSNPSSGPSSPGLAGPSFPWTFSKPTTTCRLLYLPPAHDLNKSQPSGSASSHSSQSQGYGSSLVPTAKVLSPSNSHTSLCSMRSNSSVDSTQLSEKATRELRAYARSFESVRLQRRRSY